MKHFVLFVLCSCSAPLGQTVQWPWDSAPRFLLRDRDRIFGSGFTKQVEEFGIQEVLGAPGVPQPRAYIERVIGTIRRECLDL